MNSLMIAELNDELIDDEINCWLSVSSAYRNKFRIVYILNITHFGLASIFRKFNGLLYN